MRLQRSADDYRKNLVMLVNDPRNEPEPALFGGGTLTYYGRWTINSKAARRRAVGAILLHTNPNLPAIPGAC
jgi:hypothetical protein